jgi:SAM-dependent methyltransferase
MLMNPSGDVRARGRLYTPQFYEAHQGGARRSARQIIPLVLNWAQASSVVDVGCGTGSWLAAVRECGIDDIIGVDGHHVDQDQLEIPRDKFVPRDLSGPVDLGRSFDLAISLEVAEHLPAECASTFVASLVKLAPIVLFSAAIPGQGGTHHVNEQWQDYWADFFRKHDYMAVDIIRPMIWNDCEIEWYYRQNVLIYAHRETLCRHAALEMGSDRTNLAQLALVHPRCFEHHIGVYKTHYVPLWATRELFHALARAVILSVQRRSRELRHRLRSTGR